MSNHKDNGSVQQPPDVTHPHHPIDPRPRWPIDALKIRRQLVMHMPPERPYQPSVPAAPSAVTNEASDLVAPSAAMNDASDNGWPRPEWVSDMYNNVPRFDEYDHLEGLDKASDPALLAKIAYCAFLEWKRLTSSLTRLRDELGIFKRMNQPPSPYDARRLSSAEEDRVVHALKEWDTLEKVKAARKKEEEKAERKGKGRGWRKGKKDDDDEDREGSDWWDDVVDYALYVKIAKEKILAVEDELAESVSGVGGLEAARDASSG